MKYILYHGTDRTAAEKILKTNEFITSSHDEHWLGQGVYFYLDEELAKWWTSKPTKKHGVDIKTPYILKCTIQVDDSEVLDLRKLDDYKKYCSYFYDYFTNIFINKVLSSELELKKIRCAFFDWLFSLYDIYGIRVVIGTFLPPEQKYLPKDIINIEKLNLLFIETQVCVSEESKDIIHIESCYNI